MLFFLLWTNQAVLAETQNPIILETTLLKAEYGDQVMVTGLVKPNNLVLIYINGVYSGFAKTSTNDPDMDNFSYLSSIIKNSSSHKYKVFAIARNQDSLELSGPTESPVSTIIESSSLAAADKKSSEILKPNHNSKDEDKQTTQSVSAPTLITPTGNIGEYKPIISGFSKNQTKISLFIDNILETEFWVLDQQSGTANFRYTPEKELSRGVHFVNAIAIDKDNNKSKSSNFLYFYIADPKYLATSSNIIQEENNPSISQKTNTPTTTSSSESESKTKTINSALNISLFILFILGVIIWITTTNRQLKRDEKQKISEEKK